MCGAVCVGGGWDEWWCVCGRRLGCVVLCV